MAFDQSTRNRLQKFVGEARALLTEEFTRQLQHQYGMDPATGEISDLDRLAYLDDSRRETARLLRDTLQHYLAGSPGGVRDCLQRIVREQAFTVLNRLCALRMAEARGILIESVAKGYNSKGFQLYARLAGTALGETGDAYHCYLFSIFDEFALDLAVLFDRFSPQGRLFPREPALLKLLDLINDPEIVPLWAEDETIGWIYQYFNSPEERRQMRAESQAPRNSRELAVRNQFFTPRYVVEFLTDNTLGRTWYEMTRGNTALKDRCRYLVRRPNEIFLDEGQEAPGQDKPAEELSQEELLNQPVYIPFRPLKDPREIRMLDPACGSMHFGLYAFDLFEIIYEEAWELEGRHGAEAFARGEDFQPLRETYASKEALLRDVPRLIIEHNIHGIDIDPRAVQIAGLSLWLRAQRSWQAQGIKPQDRPQVGKANITCAEPMPGDREMLREFTENLKPRVLGQLVEKIFDQMQLAGEAGSLLKIEEEIEGAVAEAREEFNKELLRRKAQQGYLPGMAPESQPALFDFTDLPDKTQFWNGAEQKILDALREYAEIAETGVSARRRLFARDAAKGFAFIDICRKRYDVVLMNPPFGVASSKATKKLSLAYPRMKSDIASAFIERCFLYLHETGVQGVLHPRNLFYIGDFIPWRQDVLFEQAVFYTCADLGLGVLDDALIEVAASVLIKNSSFKRFPSRFVRLLSRANKEYVLSKLVLETFSTEDVFDIPTKYFFNVPGCRICYWLSAGIIGKFRDLPPFKKNVGFVRQGLATGDDFRFLRNYWEISGDFHHENWVSISKGGEYSPFVDDIHLVANWKKCGGEYWEFINPKTGRSFSNIWMLPGTIRKHFFNPGVSFPQRTTSGFAPKILPKNAIFSHMSMTIFPLEEEALYQILAITNSRMFSLFVEASVGGGDTVTSGSAARRYTQNVVEGVPVPNISKKYKKQLNDIGYKIARLLFQDFLSEETNRNFICPLYSNILSNCNLYKSFLAHLNEKEKRHLRVIELSGQVDQILCHLYNLNEELKQVLTNELGTHPSKLPKHFKDKDIDVTLAFTLPLEQCIRELAKKSVSPRRELTKKVYIANRRLEVLSHFYQIHPQTLYEIRLKHQLYCKEELIESVKDILSYIWGTIFGRWDIRYATGEKEPPELPDPFDPLPVCPPGMLQNDQGLPAEPKDVPEDYPLRISWSGILVDDEGHPEDIVARMREAMEVIWGEKAGDIEQEACEILGVGSLRDYFRKPTKFFADHLKRYSKSRRQAPIYWPLSTASGSYTLWLYYHRLTGQTLYTCVNDFVEPKLKEVSEAAGALRQKTGRSKKEEKELERLASFEQELKEFLDELLRVAAFWKPDLNDGIQITAAPLWKLFRYKPWQKKLKDTWQKLEKGDYDWAHLAYSMWPERVREKCRSDKSLAIAHDLEELYEEKPSKQKKKRGGRKDKARR